MSRIDDGKSRAGSLNFDPGSRISRFDPPLEKLDFRPGFIGFPWVKNATHPINIGWVTRCFDEKLEKANKTALFREGWVTGSLSLYISGGPVGGHHHSYIAQDQSGSAFWSVSLLCLVRSDLGGYCDHFLDDLRVIGTPEGDPGKGLGETVPELSHVWASFGQPWVSW